MRIAFSYASSNVNPVVRPDRDREIAGDLPEHLEKELHSLFCPFALTGLGHRKNFGCRLVRDGFTVQATKRPVDVLDTRTRKKAFVRHAIKLLSEYLEQIGELLKTREEGLSRPEWIQRVERALDAQKARVEARIAELEAQRQQVAAARNKLVDCSACEHRPTAENNFCEPCQQTGTAIPGYLSALF